ncbi:MAG: hypothetical protein ACK41C_16220 [Phenylobacterium sp.]|uniref:hypothetical protein n=1 Tax=Phenylobacterium sp. TaxID=1871053 RepID=UPI00391CAB5C
MAKKKAKKNHLPKRIARVKVPKNVRRGRLGALLASPRGQELLAGALMTAAGGALAAHEAKRGSATRQFAARAKHAAEEEAPEVAAGASIFAQALGEAARSFADALQTGSARREIDWTAPDDASKKKPTPAPQPGL